MNPTMGIYSSIPLTTAAAATKPPKASEPVSPMNTFAGYTLNIRKPSKAPITAAEQSIKPLSANLSPMHMKNAAATAVTDEHKPSRPSVKLTPLSVPSTTNTTKGTKAHMGSLMPSACSGLPVKGISMRPAVSLSLI